MQDKIEIVEIGLDKDIKKEIEEFSMISDDIKIKIKGHLDGLKQQSVNKKTIRKNEWEGRLDVIFNLLKETYDGDPSAAVPKAAIVESITCTDKEFSPIMQKFKTYLRTTKERKWVIAKHRRKNITCYALAPFG